MVRYIRVKGLGPGAFLLQKPYEYEDEYEYEYDVCSKP